MKKIKNILLAAVLGMAFSPFAIAQLTPNGVGARDPDDLERSVELFQGCDKLVVSFNGVAQTRLITSGKGILCGVEINSVSSGQAPTTPLPITFYDVASVSGVTLASTSLGNVNKIVADQFLGPLAPMTAVSLGGAYTTVSWAGTRNNTFRHPVKFSNGIVIDHGAVNHGTISVYWIK